MKNILEDDFSGILDSKIDFEKFRNKSFLISGATGLIGSLVIRFLLFANQLLDLNMTVYALVRNKEKALKIYGNKNSHLKFVLNDLESEEPIKISFDIDFIIHAAAITTSKLMISNPVNVIETSINGTKKLLDFANNEKKVSFIYISSMEVYGRMNNSGKITESELGYLNLNNIRSCYPESKRLCEILCRSYSEQFNVNVKIARLAQTFGAGILPSENRVFAQFARSVIKGENIILHTNGSSEGNYVYTADVIEAMLIMLLNGKSGEVYNISNEDSHVTIRQMADLVIRSFGSKKQKVVIDIPKENMGYAPETKLWLSNKKMRDLGWLPKFGLIESYQRMINWMKTDEFLNLE